MSDTTKTTVYLDADVYRRLQELARTQGRPAAQCVREAVDEYTVAHSKHVRPKSIGAGHSRRGDISVRAESLLAGMGGKKRG